MLSAKSITVAYNDVFVIKDFSIAFHKGEITSIIGPNGCGKSTLLKSLARLIPITKGDVFIEGENLKSMKNKSIAKRLCLLSQHNTAPADLTVKQLVHFGRIPHKKWYEPKTKEDEDIVNQAIISTGLSDFSNRTIGSLSGGQRQRAFIALALAQKPEILLLDEPTTYLDIGFQLELMELIKEINHKFGITVIMVLHELNQASRYSDRLILMNEGCIIADGGPESVMIDENLRKVYGILSEINQDTQTNRPRIYPLASLKNTTCAM